MTSVLYHVLKWFLVLVLPFVLVVSSINYQIVKPDIYKKVLVEDKFYTQMSSELKNLKSSFMQKANVANLVNLSAIDTISEPRQLQSTVEKNIDLVADWLADKNQNWSLYLPTKELDQSIRLNIDQQTNEMMQSNQLQIPTCSKDEEQQITKVGFDLNTLLCLPNEVKNHTKSLSSFLNFKDQKDALQTVVRDNPLNIDSNIFSVERLARSNSQTLELFNSILNIRSTLVFWRNSNILISVVILLIFILVLILGLISQINMFYELKTVTRTIGINTIVFSIIFILFCGAVTFSSSWLSRFILPSFASSGIIILVTQELAKIGYTLVEPAIFAGVGFVLLSFIFGLFYRLYLKRHAEFKNQKSRFNFDNKGGSAITSH